VRGSDISRNVIVSGYVTFYQIKKSFVNFHYFQNVFSGRIWPAVRGLEIGFSGRMNSFADRSLETPDIEESAQRIEVNDDAHSLFMSLRLGYCYVKGVEQNARMLFQITRGQ